MENKELFETDLLGIAELDHLRSLDVRGLDKSLIERFIYCGSQGDAGQAVNQLLSGIGEGSMESALFRFYVVADIYLTTKTRMRLSVSSEKKAPSGGIWSAFSKSVSSFETRERIQGNRLSVSRRGILPSITVIPI